MSIGNTKSQGNKGNNFPYQLSTLRLLGDILAGVAPAGGLATELTLQQVLASIQNGQEFEQKLVMDLGAGLPYPTYVEIRLWNTVSHTFDPPVYYDASGAVVVPIGPLQFINPQYVLEQIELDAAALVIDVAAIEVINTDIRTSLQIMDDWDEANRAAVNIIPGQVGVAANAGLVNDLTQRVILASDDPAVALLTTIDSDTSAMVTDLAAIEVLITAGNVDLAAMGVLLTTEVAQTLPLYTNMNVAHDAADAGNPLKIGARAEAADIPQVDSGDRTDLIANLYGLLRIAGHDITLDVIKQIEQAPIWAHTTDPEEIVTASDIGAVDDTWVDQGSEISCNGYNTIGLYVDLIANDSTGNQLQILVKHENGGTEEYELETAADYQKTIGDLDRNIFYEFEVSNLVKFIQVQTKATDVDTGGGTEGVVTINVTKSYK